MGNLEWGGSFTRDCERQVEKGSGNGASVSEGNLEGDFSGNFEYM
jgi:hypothetical protein